MRNVISRMEKKCSGRGWNFSSAIAVKNIPCVAQRGTGVVRMDYVTAIIMDSSFATGAPILPGKIQVVSNYAIADP